MKGILYAGVIVLGGLMLVGIGILVTAGALLGVWPEPRT